MKNKLYEDILQGLNKLGEADALNFESCVIELLRKNEWPNIVPVEGGRDAGMDGVALDGSERIILIATVSRGPRVLQNVTRNLKSNRAAGYPTCGVLVATPGKLSQTQCGKIEARIRELGYSSAYHVYTREALARRLYDSPPLRKELLGLSGIPPVLSRFPYHFRPLRELPLVARDDDLAWLRATHGDCLIVGQPGIGKTFLTLQLAVDNEALFLRDANQADIADAIREANPTRIVIEDAHTRIGLLETIIRLRDELGTDFAIIADCWPTHRSDLLSHMALRDADVRELTRIPGEGIVELIGHAGIVGPASLLHELVSQADGCPGRAAMLADLCLREGLQEVWEGSALTNWTHKTFRPSVGDSAFRLLAVMGLGGNMGFDIRKAAGFLGIARPDADEAITTLAAGGIIEELTRGMLKVVPNSLRCNLVKEAFFDQSPSLDLRAALDLVPDLGRAVRTLIGAYARGASISSYELLELVEKANDQDAWEYFASVNGDHVPILLDRHPQRIGQLFRHLLRSRPDLMIQRGFELAVGDHRPLHSDPEHLLRVIEDWVDEAIVRGGNLTSNRILLLDEAAAWLEQGGDQNVGLEAVRIAMNTEVRSNSSAPGDPMKWIMKSGLIRLPMIEALEQKWPHLIDILRTKGLQVWKPVSRLLHEWIHPHSQGKAPHDDERQAFDRVAKLMLSDIAELAADRPGVMRALASKSKHLGLDFTDQLDPDFLTLFPIEDLDNWEQQQELWSKDAQALAENLSCQPPTRVAGIFGRYLKEARFADCSYPDTSSIVCHAIAQRVKNPDVWVDALMAQPVESWHVQPFLSRVHDKIPERWPEVVTRCLEHSSAAWAAVVDVLNYQEADPALVDRAIEVAADRKFLLEHGLKWNDLPKERVRRLLNHNEDHIAQAAALGLWGRRQNRTIPENLIDDWRRAIILTVLEEYRLKKLFEFDPILAEAWLTHWINQSGFSPYRSEESYETACQCLSPDQRIAILRAASDSNGLHGAVKKIVGSDASVYQVLLSIVKLKSSHLTPLDRSVDRSWGDLAQCALKAGYKPRDVALAAHRSGSWSGSSADYHRRLADEWIELKDHTDERIRQVAELGRQFALDIAKSEAKSERQEERAMLDE